MLAFRKNTRYGKALIHDDVSVFAVKKELATSKSLMAKRFRGFLPVVIDIETAGFNSKTDAILEIAAIILKITDAGQLVPGKVFHQHIEPFKGAHLEASALAFNGIDPYHPFRFAVSEEQALTELFTLIRDEIKAQTCQRGVIVAHNPVFDQSFLKAAVLRCHLSRDPFHPFTTFDTATLGALAYGQTVLARIAHAAGIAFNPDHAHSALYDAERTTEIFCHIVNHWKL